MTDHATTLMNALEHMDSIMDDLREVEPTDELTAATIHGLLRELSNQNVTALVAIAAMQATGRKDGWNLGESGQ